MITGQALKDVRWGNGMVGADIVGLAMKEGMARKGLRGTRAPFIWSPASSHYVVPL
jgi:hypothetical protein